MSFLAVVLDKVRQADLEQFREKVQSMEKTRGLDLEESGLENLDMVVKRRGDQFETFIVDGQEEYVKKMLGEQKSKTEETVKLDDNNSDSMVNFLEKIRG